MTNGTWLILLGFEIVGLWGSWMVGSGRWWAWAVVLGHSIPWFVLNLDAGLWAAAAMAPLWWMVNGANLIRWRRSRALGVALSRCQDPEGDRVADDRADPLSLLDEPLRRVSRGRGERSEGLG